MITYKDAGVDIVKAEKLVDQIKDFSKSTLTPNVVSGIGGFNAMFEVPKGYENPVMVTCTDGVGTKLNLAKEWHCHDSIGQDLVAMCVNDLLVVGAKPLVFLDYYATSKIDEKVAADVIEGIAKGCRIAKCALVGGEIAEMPGMYKKNEFDLAGFGVGVVEKDKIIDGSRIEKGDILIGLESSGLHSNGYTLINKLLELYKDNVSLDDTYHFTGERMLGDILLEPTRIYYNRIKRLQSAGIDIKGMAHITGGGLTGNIPRMREGLDLELYLDNIRLPEIFKWVQFLAKLDREEMLKTFNCGYGMVLCVSPSDADRLTDTILTQNESFRMLGRVIS